MNSFTREHAGTPRVRMLARMMSIVAVLACAFPSNAHAAPPTLTPAIHGVVKDSSGKALPNAQVIITVLGRSVRTDAEGRFAFPGLPAGTYHLRSLLIGHAPGHADVVVPASGADVDVIITMVETPMRLSSVQVTATPIASDPRDVAQSTTELSGQALTRQLGATIAQTLSAEPGISMRFNGPAATAPIIRGLQGERILVLQDGNRTADLSSAAPDHGVSMDPLTAERIEVVRGPASLLYGNSALGGVINVISNDIPSSIPNHVDGFFAGQTESATPGAAVAAGANVPMGQHLSLVLRGGARHADDLRQGGGAPLANTFYRNYYGNAGLGFGGDNANGGAVFREYRFNYGLPSGEGERSRIEGHRHELAARSDFTFRSPLVNSLRASATGQWYQHSEIDQETNAVNTSFDLKTQTLDLLARMRAGQVSGAFGASGILKQYAATGDEALTPAANSNGAGFFVYEDLPLGDVGSDPEAHVAHLQVGARYDLYHIASESGAAKFGAPRSLTFNSASGSIGITVPVGAGFSLGASAARSFRAPTVEELFSNAFHAAAGTFDVGNPNLKAETNQGIDGVLRLEMPKVNGQVSAFYNSINDYITPNIVSDTMIVGESGTTSSVPLNRFSQADATLRGVEGKVEVQVAPHVVVGGMGDMTRGRLKDGEPLPFMPAARLGALARWDNGRLSTDGEFRHAFAQDRVPASVAEGDPSAIATDSYNLLNVSVGLNLPLGDRLNTLTVRVDNLLDEKYADATSRLKSFAFNPGRNFALVYRVQF
ncbi:MAG: TonB-dependent receptor [Gemmatimonadaceae bacterium]